MLSAEAVGDVSDYCEERKIKLLINVYTKNIKNFRLATFEI